MVFIGFARSARVMKGVCRVEGYGLKSRTKLKRTRKIGMIYRGPRELSKGLGSMFTQPAR